MLQARSFEKKIAGMKSGEHFYLNAINASGETIKILRRMIRDGIVIVNYHTLLDRVPPEFIEDFVDGKRIYPQMDYIRS